MSLDKGTFMGDGPVRLEASGGVAIQGKAEVSVILGQRMMAVKLALEAGYFHHWHNHPEHESMGVVLQGRLEMKIGDELVQLGPGDVWHHPVEVYHSTRALAQTLAVEYHTPLRPDLVELEAKGRRSSNG